MKSIREEIRTRYWAPLERRHKPGAWRALDAGYGDRRRGYHSWAHIADLLEKRNEMSGLAARGDVVATAIFWHDAVYHTQNANGGRRLDRENVSDSAELFRAYAQTDAVDADAVHDMIVATADHISAKPKQQYYPGFAEDFDLFLDLDLSPLAAPWKIFEANLEKIRFEYSGTSEAEFISSQLDMLERFLKADTRLFRRAETKNLWLKSARANLTRCADVLQALLTHTPCS